MVGEDRGQRPDGDRDVITDADMRAAIRRLRADVATKPIQPVMYIVHPATFKARTECPLWSTLGTPDHVHTRLCGPVEF